MVIPAERPTIVVGGRTLNPAKVVLPVEVLVGRENPTAQPDANSMSFSWLGPLPPEFVRGVGVNATLFGYTDPGWSDVWTDLWSAEPTMPGLLPPPTPEGFTQWQVFNGGDVTHSWTDGGATLVTSWVPEPVTTPAWPGVAYPGTTYPGTT
jgi:hypothetical protein